MIRVLIADDNAVIRQGLAAVLSLAPDIVVVAEAATGREAVDHAQSHLPDVTLLDVRMPIMDGVAAAEHIAPTSRVLMLTYADEPETVAGAIQAGAVGYLVHGQFDPDELTSAIRRIARSESVLSPAAVEAMMTALRQGATVATAAAPDHPLTAREAEVMDRIAQGLSNADIADDLFVSEKTVKNHINRIYTKLQVETRSQAIARWLGSEPAAGHSVAR